MWTDAWIGIPYQDLGRGPDAYDCLGLFLAVQRVRHNRVIFYPIFVKSLGNVGDTKFISFSYII